MGRDPLGQDHMLGRQAPDLVHRFDPVALAHGELGVLDLLVEGSPDLREPGPGDRGDLDGVLACHLKLP